MEKLLTLISCFLLISCFTEPKSSNISEPMERKVENTVIPETNSTIYNNIKSKKFVYVKLVVSKPVLKGSKSDFHEVPNMCYVDYEENIFTTDIIEIDEYNEDIKYRLIDNAEKQIINKNSYINQNLYGDAVVEYGYKAAEHIKNSNYQLKIIENDVFVFDSYAEASKNRKKL